MGTLRTPHSFMEFDDVDTVMVEANGSVACRTIGDLSVLIKQCNSIDHDKEGLND